MPGSPAFDELTYDGLSLGIGSKRTVNVEPIMTPDGRTLQYLRVQIEVSAIVQPGATDTPGTLKERLNQPGKRLIWNYIGVGWSLDVGGNGPADMNGGPYPKVLHFQPLSAQPVTGAVEIQWSCEAAIWPNGTNYAGQIAAFSYSQDYSIDNGGWTTRTTEGSLVVHKKSKEPNLIEHNADDFRDSIDIAKPKGYERTQHYSLSADKATLKFTIVDRQIKTRQPYPPGVVAISATHSTMKTRSQMATTKHTISASVEVAADQPIEYAWFVFQQIVAKRIQYTQMQGVSVFIDEIRCEEEIFGLGFSASLTYRTLNDLDDWLNYSALFSPVQLQWEPWENTMHTIENNRGLSNLVPQPKQNDRRVNAANQTTPVVRDLDSPRVNTTDINSPTFCNPLPYPDKSWSHFEAYFDLYQQGVEIGHWIPMGPEAVEDGVIDFNEIRDAGRGSRVEVPSITAFNPGYATEIHFHGKAVRVGYEIPLPRLEIANAKLTMIRKQFNPRFVTMMYCQPVFAAEWYIVYQMKDLPSNLKQGIKSNGSNYGGSQNPPSGNYNPQPPNNP